MINKGLKICFSVILLAVLAVHTIDWWMTYSDDDVIETLGPHATVKYKNDCRVVSVIDTFTNKPLVVFLHGAPGSWDAFKGYMNSNILRTKADMIAIDRPGYGNSSSRPMTSINDQAILLNEVLKDVKNKEIVLVGHSYGGPIVAKAALLNGSRIKHVMMIAPVISPEHEKFWWFSYLSHWSWSKWVLPNSFETAGAEKFAHPIELGKLHPDWQKMDFPMTHIHGESDDIAPSLYNIDYSKKNLRDSTTTRLFYPDKGHMILWTDQDLIIRQIINIVERKL